MNAGGVVSDLWRIPAARKRGSKSASTVGAQAVALLPLGRVQFSLTKCIAPTLRRLTVCGRLSAVGFPIRAATKPSENWPWATWAAMKPSGFRRDRTPCPPL